MKTYNNFYVYVYLDTRKSGVYTYGEYTFNYQPFYIGKGKNNRKDNHLKLLDESNKHKNNIIKTLLDKDMKPEIIIIADNLLEDVAFNLEKELIKLIGRKNNKTGCLTNLTDGGEGSSGLKWSEESKSKIKGVNNSFYGKDHSDEAKEKIKLGALKKKGKSLEEICGEEKAKKVKKYLSESRQGDNNPNSINKGKSLEEICGEVEAKELKERWSKAHTGMKYSKETNMKKASKGEKNPMYGKSVYSVWLEKYGKEEADRKLKAQIEKSNNTKMFNKLTKGNDIEQFEGV